MSCCLFHTATQDEVLVFEGCGSKSFVVGPKICIFRPCWYSSIVVPKVTLGVNDQCTVINVRDPSLNRYEFGPQLFVINDPWERAGQVQSSIILDQDEYLIVTDIQGTKRCEKGPMKFQPAYGEVYGEKQQSVSVPVNSYIVVRDTNNNEKPVSHRPGPLKYYPTPFESIVRNPARSTTGYQAKANAKDMDAFLFDTIHVNADTAIHVQKANGSTVLISTPQYFMLEVGDRLLREVKLNVLLFTNFCILKGPDGKQHVKDGRRQADRAFFLEPFYSFVEFEQELGEPKLQILSTLPLFVHHIFRIHTSDNVSIQLNVRINYQIVDLAVFSNNPIQFYVYLKNHTQNELLGKFSKCTLREFMTQFTKIAVDSVEDVSRYFTSFGINVLDVQILDFYCSEKHIEDMLQADIHTNVRKQNELRSMQNDVLIKEQSNEVMMKMKDLEVHIAQKTNEVQLQKKQMSNQIRVTEMEIQIREEEKRTELLEVRRGNDLVEAEFVGRSQGHFMREFMSGLGDNLTKEQKVSVWLKTMDLEQATSLYNAAPVNMLPPGADLKIFRFGDGEEHKVDSHGNVIKISKNSTASEAALAKSKDDKILAQRNLANEAVGIRVNLPISKV